jgi:hypothetical protein
MSRILKRPMFRRGGSTNTGIMSGLVDRTKHAENPFVTTVGQTASKLTPELEAILEQYTPKTRLPIGEFGLNLASGMTLTDALRDPYKRFTRADDAREAAIKGGAAKLAIGQALKVPKDKRTTAEKNADALNLTGDERAAYIKGATLKTEAAASDLQGKGQIAGKGKRDDIINSRNFVERQLGNIDEINKLLGEDPTLGGGVGQLRKIAFDTITLGSDLGFDVSPIVKKFGGEKTLLNTNTARLEALEDLLVPGLARVMNPNTRITNQMLNEAKRAINLTGLKGSEAVQTKLKEIKSQFEQYIADQNTLLGSTTPKKYKVVNGKLVEQ